MPTENRSSNTDPRDVFIRLNPLGLGEAELRKDSTGFEDQRTHSDYLLFLAGYRESQQAQQHHAEPIAWIVDTAIWWTKEEAERDAAATGLPVVPVGPMVAQHGEPAWFMTEGGVSALHAKAKAMSDQQGLDTSSYSVPLYTHADPGEVERLRGIIRMHEKTVQEQADHLAYMRAQLAERDALLVDIRLSGMDDERCARVDLLLSSGAYANAINKHPLLRTSSDNAAIEVFLSASAEPSTPVEIDERAEFESWYIRDVGIGLANLSRINSGSRAYEEEDAMAAWEGWQARAALERKP